MTQVSLNRFANLAVLLLIGLLFGCGSSSNVGYVSGTVTLDGQPLESTTVMFHPESGRASVGKTDAEGRYELVYTRQESGALIGAHKVTISTVVYAEESRTIGYDRESTGPSVTGRPETMPDHYREKSATVLTATVKSGKNQIDFPLTTDKP